MILPTKHKQGPYLAYDCPDQPQGYYNLMTTDKEDVASAVWENEIHLFKAAPTLYEALCDMVSDRDCLSDATIRFAEQALKKARGAS